MTGLQEWVFLSLQNRYNVFMNMSIRGDPMTGKQISIYLPEAEARALVDLAVRECRRPNDQVRYIIRQALELASENENRHDELPVESRQVMTVTA